jgi:Right handed beta helix region/Protein of unknown function (DUF1565)
VHSNKVPQEASGVSLARMIGRRRDTPPRAGSAPAVATALGALILLASTVGATAAERGPDVTRDWYVATTGSDTNPGTQDAPFRTITKGVSVVRPGDTVWVREGVYPESFMGNIPGGTSWTKRVKLAAVPGETVTIRPDPGAEFAFRFDSSNDRYIVVDGFVIDAANVEFDAVKITYSSSAAHHIRFRNVEILRSPGNGILISRSRRLVPQYNEFINLEIHDNGTTDFDHGMYIASGNNVVRNSLIYRNAGWGLHVYNGDYPRLTADNNVIRNNRVFDNGRVGGRGAGIILSSGRNNTAYNNLLWGNKGGIQIDYGASRAKAFNNTVYGNGYGVYVGAESTRASVKNNIVFGNNEGGVIDEGSDTTRRHNLRKDPQFVDAASLDFHLQTSSPAIDAGAAIRRVSRDFDGVSRPQCNAYDIGAYEFDGCP